MHTIHNTPLCLKIQKEKKYLGEEVSTDGRGGSGGDTLGKWQLAEFVYLYNCSCACVSVVCVMDWVCCVHVSTIILSPYIYVLRPWLVLCICEWTSMCGV